MLQLFLDAATFWNHGPSGHLMHVDFAALKAAWDGEARVVAAAQWLELRSMLNVMKAIVNTHVNEKLAEVPNA